MSATYSVVIPAYNSEKTIGACLTSVAAQSFAPLEVLVIDDRSLDRTGWVIQQCAALFAAAGITLVYHQLEQNSGPSVARNKGMYLAKGSHIAFLDADDVWHRDKLAIVDRFVCSIRPGLLYHAYSDTPVFDVRSDAGNFGTKFLSIYEMLLRNPAQTSCVVICKQTSFSFNESMRYCEDFDLWLQIGEGKTVVGLICNPLTGLGRPQLTAGGLSGNTTQMRIGEMRAYYNFCRRSMLTRIWFLPIFLAFSVIKHVYSRIRTWDRGL